MSTIFSASEWFLWYDACGQNSCLVQLALAFSAACRFLSWVLSVWVEYIRRCVLTILRVHSKRPSLSGRTLSIQHPGIVYGSLHREVVDWPPLLGVDRYTARCDVANWSRQSTPHFRYQVHDNRAAHSEFRNAVYGRCSLICFTLDNISRMGCQRPHLISEADGFAMYILLWSMFPMVRNHWLVSGKMTVTWLEHQPPLIGMSKKWAPVMDNVFPKDK